MKYIETNKQHADVFTKAANLDKLQRINSEFGIIDYEGVLKYTQLSDLEECRLVFLNDPK